MAGVINIEEVYPIFKFHYVGLSLFLGDGFEGAAVDLMIVDEATTHKSV
jgi:hypothetical protein